MIVYIVQCAIITNIMEGMTKKLVRCSKTRLTLLKLSDVRIASGGCHSKQTYIAGDVAKTTKMDCLNFQNLMIFAHTENGVRKNEHV